MAHLDKIFESEVNYETTKTGTLIGATRMDEKDILGRINGLDLDSNDIAANITESLVNFVFPDYYEGKRSDEEQLQKEFVSETFEVFLQCVFDEVDALKEQNESWESEYNHLEEQYSSLEEDNKELEEQKEELEEDMDALREDINEKQDEVDTQKSEISDKEDLITELKEKIQELEEELREYKDG